MGTGRLTLIASDRHTDNDNTAGGHTHGTPEAEYRDE